MWKFNIFKSPHLQIFKSLFVYFEFSISVFQISYNLTGSCKTGINISLFGLGSHFFGVKK